MINLYHFQYFVDAARAGSLSAAAKKHLVSQSAVSQAIRALEGSLGFRLTTHQKKVLHLTDEGKAILLHSDQVFQSVEALTEAVQNIGSGYYGKLSIACTNSIAIGFLPPVVAAICAAHPNIRPILRIGNSETIKDWIMTGEVELGLMVDDGDLTREFKKFEISSGNYILFQSRDQDKSDMQKLVVTRRERKEVQYFLRKLKHLNAGTEIFCEITSWEAIKPFVLSFGGCGICPDYVLDGDPLSKKLQVMKVQFKLPKYKLIATHSARKPLGKTSSLLLDRLTGK